jgi:hypothetical protein
MMARMVPRVPVESPTLRRLAGLLTTSKSGAAWALQNLIVAIEAQKFPNAL